VEVLVPFTFGSSFAAHLDKREKWGRFSDGRPESARIRCDRCSGYLGVFLFPTKNNPAGLYFHGMNQDKDGVWRATAENKALYREQGVLNKPLGIGDDGGLHDRLRERGVPRHRRLAFVEALAAEERRRYVRLDASVTVPILAACSRCLDAQPRSVVDAEDLEILLKADPEMLLKALDSPRA
jgi:hypothetical protein